MFYELQIDGPCKWFTLDDEEGHVIPAMDYEEKIHGPIRFSYHGYGVRLSAPGYLDCTEWDVFESLTDAEEYARENLCDCEYDLDDPDECPVCSAIGRR